MPSSLPMGSWPAQLLGSCIEPNGKIYGGHTAAASNIFQRPALL